MTRAFPEQTRQEKGAYKQAPFLESVLKNTEFVQSGVLNLPDLHDITEIPDHHTYITVCFFFLTEIQESIYLLHLSKPLAIPPALTNIILQSWNITSLPYLNTRDL